MAAGKLIMNKASGGVLNVTSTDGTTSTDLVLPLSGTVTNVTTAVTDNAIARFDGTTGTLQNSGVTIDDNGNVGSGTQTFNGFGGSGFKNYIINGNFNVWQRGTSFSFGATGANVYHTDRFASASTFSTGSVCIDKSAITYNNVKYNSAKCTVTTAYNTSGANTAYRHFCYFFEGINSTVVNKGFTLSFLFNTNVAGTYTVSFRCEGGIVSAYKTRITAISGVQKITIVVPANTITTPTLDANMGLQIYIAGVAGSTYSNLSTTLNQWDSSILTLYYPNEMNWAGTVGNYVEIAQVQLEEGSIATPFENRPYGLELSLCQRYFEKSYADSVAIGTLTNENAYCTSNLSPYLFHSPIVNFKVPKRIQPTIVIYNPYASNTGNAIEYNTGSVAVSDRPIYPLNVGKNCMKVQSTNGSLVPGNFVLLHYTASAEL